MRCKYKMAEMMIRKRWSREISPPILLEVKLLEQNRKDLTLKSNLAKTKTSRLRTLVVGS